MNKKEMQYHLDIINARKAWGLTKGSKEITIGVVDCAFWKEHPALKGQFIEILNPTPYSSEEFCTVDKAHGTGMAGIIGARHDDPYLKGIAPNVSLIALQCGIPRLADKRMKDMPKLFEATKISEESGRKLEEVLAEIEGGLEALNKMEQYAQELEAYLVKCIRLAADNDIKVLSLSLTGVNTPDLENAIKYADSKGVILAGSSGNTNVPRLTHPAAYEEVIACGGVDKNLNRWVHQQTGEVEVFGSTVGAGSNYGKGLHVMAPIENVYSAYPSETELYHTMGTGTSHAAPQLAATISLMLSVNPKLKSKEIKELLRKTAKPLHGQKRWRKEYGYGLLDVFEAVKKSL